MHPIKETGPQYNVGSWMLWSGELLAESWPFLSLPRLSPPQFVAPPRYLCAFNIIDAKRGAAVPKSVFSIIPYIKHTLVLVPLWYQRKVVLVPKISFY